MWDNPLFCQDPKIADKWLTDFSGMLTSLRLFYDTYLEIMNIVSLYLYILYFKSFFKYQAFFSNKENDTQL